MSKPGTIRYANNACIRLTYLITSLSYLLSIIIYMKYIWRWPKLKKIPLAVSYEDFLLTLLKDIPSVELSIIR